MNNSDDLKSRQRNDSILLLNIFFSDKQQKERNDRVNFTRYMTYLGLCVATCIILQRNTIVASLLGLFVALYITVSEYWLASSTKDDLSPFNFGKILDIMS